MERGFSRIMRLQLANIFVEAFAWNFVYLQAHNAGFSETSIATFFALMFGWAALSIPAIMRPTRPGPSMALGLGLRIVALIAITEIAFYHNLLVAAILHGAFVVLFWVPYNVVFLRMTTDADRAGRSTQLFALFAVASAVFPLVGGYLLEREGFWVVTMIAGAAALAGAVIAARSDWGEVVRFDLRNALRTGRHVAPLVTLEGFWQGVLWIAVPIGTLRMVDQGAEYGAFLAFLGIMGGAASILAGRWSDRTQDRWPPLLASGVGVAVFTVAVPFGEGNLTLWSMLAGLAYFFSYMLMAFTFTVVAEMGMTIDDTMGLRELMFNIGRSAGAGLFILSLVLGLPLAWPLAGAAAATLIKVMGYWRFLKGDTSDARAPASQDHD